MTREELDKKIEEARKRSEVLYVFHFENIIFSYANIADCKIAEKLAEAVKGTIFADAGFL